MQFLQPQLRRDYGLPDMLGVQAHQLVLTFQIGDRLKIQHNLLLRLELQRWNCYSEGWEFLNIGLGLTSIGLDIWALVIGISVVRLAIIVRVDRVRAFLIQSAWIFSQNQLEFFGWNVQLVVEVLGCGTWYDFLEFVLSLSVVLY